MTPNEQAIYDALCKHFETGARICSYQLATMTHKTRREVSAVISRYTSMRVINISMVDFDYGRCAHKHRPHQHYRWNGPHEEQP